MTLGELGERRAIARLTALLGSAESATGVRLGIGHDAALLAPPAGCDLVLTTDQQAAGTHFDFELMGAQNSGGRMLAAAVSDLAPFGAEPLWVVIGLAAMPSTKLESLERLYRGISQTAAELSSQLTVVGGDLISQPGSLTVSLTVIGSRPASWKPGGRSEAAPGETIYLSGATGLAAAGLWQLQNPTIELPDRAILKKAFLSPQIELRLGQRLWQDGRLTTAADTSDSLTEQLELLAEASQVGILIEESRIPLPQSLLSAAEAMKLSPIELALGGGEDFILLITAPAGLEQEFSQLIPIGRTTKPKDGCCLVTANGEKRSLPRPLFTHYQETQEKR